MSLSQFASFVMVSLMIMVAMLLSAVLLVKWFFFPARDLEKQKCPSCSRTVSRVADFCPDCGKPFPLGGGRRA